MCYEAKQDETLGCFRLVVRKTALKESLLKLWVKDHGFYVVTYRENLFTAPLHKLADYK